MISLLELLRSRGFEPNVKRVKMMRHKDSRYGDVDSLRKHGWFELYQSIQKPATLRGRDQIVAFIGEDGGLASRFIGVYDILSRSPAEQHPLPDDCPFKEWNAPGSGSLFHELRKRTGFEDMEDRVIVDWEVRRWDLQLKDKPVLEIRPSGRKLEPFRDYLRVDLKFEELRYLAANADAHRDWVSGLSAVGAIYLVVNQKDGQQYVGSATGRDGLWQRWRNYAHDGHASNKRLQELCETPGAGCPEAFRFSILETFSRNHAPKEALKLESFFKNKLGSRAFGLNEN